MCKNTQHIFLFDYLRDNLHLLSKLKVEHFICFGTILKTHLDFKPYVDLVQPVSIF